MKARAFKRDLSTVGHGQLCVWVAGFLLAWYIPIATCWAEIPEKNVAIIKGKLAKLNMVSEEALKDKNTFQTELSKYQDKYGKTVTGILDEETALSLLFNAMNYDAVAALKKEGKVIQIKVTRQGFREIYSMPAGTVWYMSKTNSFKALEDLNVDESGVWPTQLLFNLAKTIKYCGTGKWDSGQAIGNAHWGKLFINDSKMKLFVGNQGADLETLDEPICGTGGGLRIEFVLEESEASAKPVIPVGTDVGTNQPAWKPASSM